MKILVIISSFRKKNTYNSVKHIEKIHKETTSCDYEYVFLKDMDIKPCIGCHMCLTKGEEFCPLKDELGVLIDKIESSDGVIMACPNHVRNVNWLMKNLIDRLSYTMHRPMFFKQRFMVLITSGSIMGTKEAINALSPLASGGKVISKFAVLNSPGMSEKKRARLDKMLDKKGSAFVKLMNKDYMFKASLPNIMWFSAFKAMTHTDNTEFEADFNYYKDKTFFVKRELNFFKRSVLKLSERFFVFLIKRGVM